MPQGNGSPPVWRWPPAFLVRRESQLRATGSGAWWRGGDGAAVGRTQQRGRVGGDGGAEDGAGGGEGLTRRGGAAGRGRIKRGVWDKEET